MPCAAPSVSSFCSLHSSLLQLEREEEVSRAGEGLQARGWKALEQEGRALRHLRLDHQATGLYGRRTICLKAKRGGKEELPANQITTGE